MGRALHIAQLLVFLLAVTNVVACGGSAGTPFESPQAPNPGPVQNLLPLRSSGIEKIQHVVIVVQENRSFDNLFQGFPEADTRSYGYDSYGRKIKLKPIDLGILWDVDHEYASFMDACNGTGSYPGTDCRMNGFNKEMVYCGTGSYPPCPIRHPQYAYVPQSETKPYFDMASQYVLADRMFTSNFDASSFVAHQYLIAAQSNAAVNYPDSNDWGCEGGPSDTIQTLTQQRTIHFGYRDRVCFKNYRTLGDELDDAGLSWRYYTAKLPRGSGDWWSAYSAVRHIYYGPDWKKDVISPQTRFFGDIQKGDLPVVTWITPSCPNSDHAGCTTNNGGPSWVASIVNAIGESKYWNSTAIFVTWDDYGGWYDHVPPKMLDYDGLGFRVPLLVISPYAKKGHVSHVHYELSSILRFVEDRFGLPTLSASDARATDPADDCCNFDQPPREFQKIASPLSEEYFLHQALDPRPPDNE